MDKKTKLIIAGVAIGVLLIAAVWMNMQSSRGPSVPQKAFDDAANIANEMEKKQPE